MKQFFTDLVNWINSLFGATMLPMSTEQPTTVSYTNVPNTHVESTTEPVAVIYNPTPKTVVAVPTKLDLWCNAAIRMEGANPIRNNPFNVRYVLGTWMQKLATGENGGFCVFKDYETGYAVGQKIFTNAATGKSQIYHPTMTLYEFYKVYAPASDDNDPLHYSQVVAAEIATGYPGVTNETVISTLV